MYNQIVHHGSCFFSLLIIKEVKSIKTIFFYISAYVLYKNFLPTTHSINLHLGIIALVLDFYRHTGHVRLKFLRMNKNS